MRRIKLYGDVSLKECNDERDVSGERRLQAGSAAHLLLVDFEGIAVLHVELCVVVSPDLKYFPPAFYSPIPPNFGTPMLFEKRL